MPKPRFDYLGAKEEGYSDEDIFNFLRESHQDFDYEGALKEGYSPAEINQFISYPEAPERSNIEKAGRVGAQFLTGLAEAEALPYDIAVAPLASQDAQISAYRQNLSEDLERLQEQKSMGLWDEQDQELYDSIVNQIKNPEASREFVQTADISSRGLIEKATGMDLTPENMAEEAALFTGFIKNPEKLGKSLSGAIKPRQLLKNLMPTGTEALRGVGAASGLEFAKDGNFGPLGTMAAVVTGDAIGGGLAKAGVEGAKFALNPKQRLAEVLAKFPSQEQKALQRELIKDARNAGITLDIGTLTDSNAVKVLQSRLAQSGLVGKELDALKKELKGQFLEEYKSLSDALGELKYENQFEAGNALQSIIKGAEKAELDEVRQVYNRATEALEEGAFVTGKAVREVDNNIDKLIKKFTPGMVKSTEQKTMLDTLQKLKLDIVDAGKEGKGALVEALINNKRALQDLVDYEVQGGVKQLLKTTIKDLDRAIISHGKENPTFAKNYILGNKKFSQHSKTFRNKDISKLLFEQTPEKLLNQMNTVSGIKKLEKAMSALPQGKELLDTIKRYKVEQLIGEKNLVDSTSQQLKLGTFAKILEKGKNRELLKELLPKESFKRLERLTKLSGNLAESTYKFFNSSQSAVAATDAAIILRGLMVVGHLLTGNPWPLLKEGAIYGGARKLAGYFGDPEFLKLVEDAILSAEKQSPEMVSKFMKLKPYFLEAFSTQD